MSLKVWSAQLFKLVTLNVPCQRHQRHQLRLRNRQHLLGRPPSPTRTTEADMVRVIQLT